MIIQLMAQAKFKKAMLFRGQELLKKASEEVIKSKTIETLPRIDDGKSNGKDHSRRTEKDSRDSARSKATATGSFSSDKKELLKFLQSKVTRANSEYKPRGDKELDFYERKLYETRKKKLVAPPPATYSIDAKFREALR